MDQKLKNKKTLKLGILGMSPGNAHPYSWSSIINGKYDGQEISRIGYPGVTDYLNHYQSELGIPGAVVSHVWSQDPAVTQSIAESAGIENCVDRYQDMIGAVDAVIIARDDPENHRAMAEEFIDAYIPLFIDKPLAASTEDLEYFREMEQSGRWIMSCSSMRYSAEVNASLPRLKSIGKVHLVTAVGKKDWLKYGVHMLEAVFTLLGDPIPISIWSVGKENRSVMRIEFMNGILATVHLFQNISSTFQVSVYGSDDYETVVIGDSYRMFRANLEEFVRGLREGHSLLPFEKTYQIVRTVVGGLESMKTGKKIEL